MSDIKDRTNEENINSIGLKMKIIKYRNSTDLDIQFEDGTVVEHRAYKEFKLGVVKHPLYDKANNRLKNISKKRIGETNIANCGMKMTIIEYRNSMDIDVKFENGYISRNKSYANFKKGIILNYDTKNSDKIGKTNIANCGMKMTIIEYRKTSDIDVKFEDGAIVKHRTYTQFKLGQILNPNIRQYNFEGVSSKGQKMKIIKFHNYNDITVKFEDGTIIEHSSYQRFKSGRIKNPNFIEKEKYYCTNFASIGLNMKVINYKNSKDVDIEFEDGEIVKGKNFTAFKKGFIKHPKFVTGNLISKNYFGFEVNFAFKTNDKVYYHARNLKTDKEFVMTLQEIYQMAVR